MLSQMLYMKPNGSYIYFLTLVANTNMPSPSFVITNQPFTLQTIPVFHEQTKYIEMDCHIVRDKVQTKILYLMPFHSSKQVAYMFTKPLHHVPFSFLADKL